MNHEFIYEYYFLNGFTFNLTMLFMAHSVLFIVSHFVIYFGPPYREYVCILSRQFYA